ncbi:MAG: DUF1573 domain-containing protein [Bacteroidales bacterium]|nr:DUF1573 domain-containing protein [Bacteroidales bacterium]
MKNNLSCFVFLFSLLLTIFSCGSGKNTNNNSAENALNQEDTLKFPQIEFDTAVFNFGKILQGEQVSYVFKFQNTGQADLMIQKVETSCGCTVPEFSKTPVKPGEKGEIRVRFDSHGKDGTQYKTVKVISNCKDNIFDLVVTGVVEN